MKERQWLPSEKDSQLHTCEKQCEARELNHVSQRMNRALDRVPKSRLESWKNYLKPGIKIDEQPLVICLEGKHGNRLKKIADEVPGTAAKKLGKRWELYREKQEEIKDTVQERTIGDSPKHTIEEGKYDDILETFAERYMQRQKQLAGNLPSIAAMPYGLPPPISLGMPTNPAPDFISYAIPILPPWVPNSGHGFGTETFLNSSPRLSNSSPLSCSSPSVTLSLSPSSSTPVMSGNTASASACSSWMKNITKPNVSGCSEAEKEKSRKKSHIEMPSMDPTNLGGANQSEIIEEMSVFLQNCRELEERQQSWSVFKKETCWRLKRLEQQLEAEKSRKRQEKMEEIELKVRALREEESLYFDRLEADYKEQISRIHRDAEIKDGRMMEMWMAKHVQLAKFFEQIVHRDDSHKASSESH